MTVKEEALKKIMERCCVLFGKKMEDLNENTRFIEDEFDVEISFMEFRRKATLGLAAEYIEELCEE